MTHVTLKDKRSLRQFLKSFNDVSDVQELGFLPNGEWIKDPDNKKKYYMIYIISVEDILERIFKIKTKKRISVDKSITVFFKELENTLTDYFAKKWKS